MRDTGGDWTRRHARLDPKGSDEDGAQADDTDDTASIRPGTDDERPPLVRAEDPPTDDWRARHAWCQRR